MRSLEVNQECTSQNRPGSVKAALVVRTRFDAELIPVGRLDRASGEEPGTVSTALKPEARLRVPQNEYSRCTSPVQGLRSTHQGVRRGDL